MGEEKRSRDRGTRSLIAKESGGKGGERGGRERESERKRE